MCARVCSPPFTGLVDDFSGTTFINVNMAAYMGVGARASSEIQWSFEAELLEPSSYDHSTQD